MSEAGEVGFNRDVTPYPPDGSVAWRLLAMPVGRPDPAPSRPRAVRRDGTTVDLLATLGVSIAGPAADDDQVRDWTPA